MMNHQQTENTLPEYLMENIAYLGETKPELAEQFLAEDIARNYRDYDNESKRDYCERLRKAVEQVNDAKQEQNLYEKMADHIKVRLMQSETQQAYYCNRMDNSSQSFHQLVDTEVASREELYEMAVVIGLDRAMVKEESKRRYHRLLDAPKS